MLNKILIILGGVLLIVVIFFGIKFLFEDGSWNCENGKWVKFGNPKTEMPLAECKGVDLVEEVPVQVESIENEENFRNLNIKNQVVVSSPLTITGEVKGSWFFEGVMPVAVTGWMGRINGGVLNQVNVMAKEDWMTDEFVPFEVVIDFEVPEHQIRGDLIFKKANPSGLPENDASYKLTIYFADNMKDFVSFEEVKNAVENCEARSVMQTHAGEVTVDLKDGGKLKALQKNIDNIIHVAVEARKSCPGDLIIATE